MWAGNRIAGAFAPAVLIAVSCADRARHRLGRDAAAASPPCSRRCACRGGQATRTVIVAPCREPLGSRGALCPALRYSPKNPEIPEVIAIIQQ
jgi:hypothetical protein